jgi:hypothetical protein
VPKLLEALTVEKAAWLCYNVQRALIEPKKVKIVKI